MRSLTRSALDLLPTTTLFPDPEVKDVANQCRLHLSGHDTALYVLDGLHSSSNQIHCFITFREIPGHIRSGATDHSGTVMHLLPTWQNGSRRPVNVPVSYAGQPFLRLPIHGAKDSLHQGLRQTVGVSHWRRRFIGGHADRDGHTFFHTNASNILGADHVDIDALHWLAF